MLIKTFYQDILGISDEKLLRLLCDATDIRHLTKGELLIGVGAVQKDLYFLRNGILRGFYFDVEGKDITDCLLVKCGTPAMSCFAFGDDATATINVEALTDTDIFCLPVAVVKDLLEEHPDLIRVYNQLLVESLRSHWEIKSVVSQKSAADRYQWFLSAYPGVIDRITQKYIASFLGISPVHFSRIHNTMQESRIDDLTK